MLAYELYLKNKDDTVEHVKPVPVKKVFVKVDDKVNLQLDSKTLEHYGENVSQNDKNAYFKKSLSMPSNNLASVGLPYRGTGAAAKKPYVEFFGSYKKGRLKIFIAGEGNKGQKPVYEYLYDFSYAKETAIVPFDFLILRLDQKSYFVKDKLLFDVYKENGVITTEGALPSNIFVEVCRAFSSLWQAKIAPEELKEYSSFVFRIVVLPLSLLPDGKVEHQCNAEDGECSGAEFYDCFGNFSTGHPSKATQNAKFLSFDDEAFTLNCKRGKEFYQNLGIGNQSFPKINLPSGGFTIAGLDWYFFDITKPSFDFEQVRSGIYDQLLSNYNRLVKDAGESAATRSAIKIVCAKKAQAKLEVLLDENLTLEQLKKMLSRIQDGFARHPMALEWLIIKRNNEPVWTDYLIAIRHFFNGTFIDRAFLVQRFTLVLRENLRGWLKGIKLDSEDFFEKSKFCLKLLTKTEEGLDMNKNEEYAYKIGCIAGKYVKFERERKEANNSTNDILTYSKYDRERLRFVYNRIGLGISLSKSNTDDLSQSIKGEIPLEEIEDVKAQEDFSYFFYKGVFQNLT
ncbi:MAG: hypothetical protein ACFCUE_04360 [Candidatus Bathyarchaeia archaeon]|jgi:hypothetical protein